MSDNLLIALGAIGNMSLPKFNNIFIYTCMKRATIYDSINLKIAIYKARQFLDSSGHCEFDFDENRMYTCSPTILTLPFGLCRRAVLVGGRSKDLLDKICNYQRDQQSGLEINIYNQNIYNSFEENKGPIVATLPSSIILQELELGELQNFATYIGAEASIETPAAWLLANYSGGIGEYIDKLKWHSKFHLKWPRRLFSITDLCFHPIGSELKIKEGLIEYTEPIRNQRICYFFKDGAAACVDRDWGRYMALAENGVKAVIYDKRTNRLGIPSTIPFPSLLARAVALCSGRQPVSWKSNNRIENIHQGTHFDIYFDVPTIYAQLILKKLLQSPLNSPIEFDQRKVVAE